MARCGWLGSKSKVICFRSTVLGIGFLGLVAVVMTVTESSLLEWAWGVQSLHRAQELILLVLAGQSPELEAPSDISEPLSPNTPELKAPSDVGELLSLSTSATAGSQSIADVEAAVSVEHQFIQAEEAREVDGNQESSSLDFVLADEPLSIESETDYVGESIRDVAVSATEELGDWTQQKGNPSQATVHSEIDSSLDIESHGVVTAMDEMNQPATPASQAADILDPPTTALRAFEDRKKTTTGTQLYKTASFEKGNCAFRKWTPQRPQCKGGKGRKDSDYQVLNFEETFARLRAGMSITRYGDGELRLMEGVGEINHGMEVNSPEIKEALIRVAQLGGDTSNIGICVGLVELFDPKKQETALRKSVFGRQRTRYSGMVRSCFPPGTYCSASITRPDHWSTHSLDEIVAEWARVFDGKRVLYVRPSGAPPGNGAAVFKKVHTVWSPNELVPTSGNKKGKRSFSQRDKIRAGILAFLAQHQVDIVALSIGPTATILVADIACMGVQVLDFGSMAGRMPTETPSS